MLVRPTPLLIVASLALGAVALTPAVSQASSKASVSSVLAAAKLAMVGEKSVHIVVSSKSGKTVNHVTADLGTASGQENFVSGTANVVIRVTAKNAYLSGNAAGLTNLVGLTSAQEKKVGNRVIVMKAGTSPYTTFQSNLTVSAFATFLPTQKGVKLSTDSHKDYVLTWTKAATSTTSKTTSVLTISSGKKALPISEVVTGTTGGGTTEFSRWGKSFTVTAPPSSKLVAYTSIISG